jgi:hypothetical protein
MITILELKETTRTDALHHYEVMSDVAAVPFLHVASLAGNIPLY